MEQLALYALDCAKSAGADYADVRLIERETESIQTKDLTVAGLDIGRDGGIGIRVLVGGGWGFAGTASLNKSDVARAAVRAVEVASASAKCLNREVTLAEEAVYDATWVSPHLVDPFSISLERKLEVLFSSAKTMLAVKGVTLAQGLLTFIKERKLFVSTQGSRIRQTFIRSSCWIEANASDDNDRQRRSYPNSGGGQHELAGWEMVERWNLPANAERIATEAVALLKAPQCPEGQMNLIIGSSQLGLQIHESCGHPSELDRALKHEVNFAGASFLTPNLLGNLQYGSSIVNLVADATANGALGSFGFDDEGVAAQCVPIVKDGIFSGYLSSRDTAGLIGLSRSGGAMRAESWAYQPIIRMTNISLMPGNAGSLDDLIADTGDGLLIETNKSWSIDSLRYNFQFSTEIGWLIKNGRRQGIVKNPSYGGMTTEFWGGCDAICSPETYVEWGVPNCGKGQPCQTMWTGHGAAPSRFRKVSVGVARSN